MKLSRRSLLASSLVAPLLQLLPPQIDTPITGQLTADIGTIVIDDPQKATEVKIYMRATGAERWRLIGRVTPDGKTIWLQ